MSSVFGAQNSLKLCKVNLECVSFGREPKVVFQEYKGKRRCAKSSLAAITVPSHPSFCSGWAGFYECPSLYHTFAFCYDLQAGSASVTKGEVICEEISHLLRACSATTSRFSSLRHMELEVRFELTRD